MRKCWIRDATRADVYYVSLRMKERDFQEINALRFDETREEMAESLALQFGDVPFVMCFGYDDTPVGLLMGLNAWPGTWSIGMWSTPELYKVKKYITGICSNEFFGAMRSAGAHRVECKSIVGYTEVHKWLHFLGFRQSKEIEKYGKNGENFITFEWVEGMPWPRGYNPTAEN